MRRPSKALELAGFSRAPDRLRASPSQSRQGPVRPWPPTSASTAASSDVRPSTSDRRAARCQSSIIGIQLVPTSRARRAIARSWIARPVESKTVISSSTGGPARPRRGRRRARSRPRVSAPASTAWTRSPLWLACSQSSAKTRTRDSSSTAISALPGPSAPIRLTCCPGRNEPSSEQDLVPGVIVTRRSEPSASSRPTDLVTVCCRCLQRGGCGLRARPRPRRRWRPRGPGQGTSARRRCR